MCVRSVQKLPVILLGILIMGCQQPQVLGRSESGVPTSSDPTRTLLMRSPAVASYARSILPNNWAYMLDAEVNGARVVAVWEDRPDHFTRGLTAKITEDHRIYILVTDSHGDESWQER